MAFAVVGGCAIDGEFELVNDDTTKQAVNARLANATILDSDDKVWNDKDWNDNQVLLILCSKARKITAPQW